MAYGIAILCRMIKLAIRNSVYTIGQGDRSQISESLLYNQNNSPNIQVQNNTYGTVHSCRMEDLHDQNEMLFKLALANASRHVLLRSKVLEEVKSSVCIRSKHIVLPGLPDHADHADLTKSRFSHTWD